MAIIETDRLRKEYGTLVAVNDIDFSVEKGQVIGLIGPNGAGKTTLLRMLATLLTPTSGKARVLGCDLAKDYLAIRNSIGYLPDFFNLYNDLTLRECLEFFGRSYGVADEFLEQKIDQALEYVELKHKENEFFRHLSRGMVQRMGLASLLVRDPELFLLDEPASGLDPKARIQLRQVLKKLGSEGRTVIISSHILTEMEGLCSHIAIMNHGQILQFGSVDEIRRRVSGARRAVISVLDDVARAEDLLRAQPDVFVQSVQDHAITLEFTGEREKLAELNAVLVRQNVKVVSLYEEKMDIEDLFMKISLQNN